MFALNPVGITGSIVQQINHGISTGALFLLVGVVYERRHTREIAEYGGLSKVMPVYAAVFLDHDDVVDRAAGAERIHRRVPDPAGRVRRRTRCGPPSAASGIVLGAAYMLWLYQRTMFGKIENPKNEHLRDLSLREFATFAPLLVLGVLDRPLPGAVPAPARHVGRPRRSRA